MEGIIVGLEYRDIFLSFLGYNLVWNKDMYNIDIIGITCYKGIDRRLREYKRG